MMSTVVIDIETDAIDATLIHCLCCLDLDTGEENTFFGSAAVDYIKKFDKVVAHNGIGFDFPVLARLWGLHLNFDQIVDTYVMSMLFNPAIEKGHSLKAWGQRLGLYKTEYEGGFDQLSDEMVDYCVQDVRVAAKLYTHLVDAMQEFSEQSIRDEHRMKIVADRVSRTGFRLDREKTKTLHNRLMQEQDEIAVECASLFPPKIKERYSEKTGKRLKDKVTEFNPSSRQQIAERLMELGWKPRVFTETGQAKVDERTLGECDLDVAKKLAKYFLLQKRTSQIKSWLKRCSSDSRVHCRYRTLGAITNRMSCVEPNLQQVPAVRVEYGKECREVWVADPGKILLDTDAAGLELRVLAHYMDDERFTREILEGDVHTANQQMAGLETRDQAKTFIYALLYGAGDAKIGAVVNGSASDGAQLRARFMANMPAYKRLSEAVTRKGESVGKLKALDGRVLRVRSAHASLNTLIQGSSAVLMKKWFMYVDHHLRGMKIDASIVAMIHDELVLEIPEKDVDPVKECVILSIRQVNKSYNLRCGLDCDVQVGNNWSEIH